MFTDASDKLLPALNEQQNQLPTFVPVTAADILQNKQSAKPLSTIEIAKKLNTVAADPEQMSQIVESMSMYIDNHSPLVAQNVQLATANMLNFLASKAPKVKPMAPGMPDVEPTHAEITKFQRYLDAVENPTAILDDATSGALTSEAIEAVQTVYPNLFKEIQAQVAERVINAPKIPYHRKLQISALLGQDMSGTQNSKMALLAQSVHGSLKQPPPQRQQQMPVSRAQGLNMAGRAGQETAAWREAQKDYGR